MPPRLFAITTTLWLLVCVSTAQSQPAPANTDWPQWRGPNRDGVSRETGLLKEWSAAGPAVVWQVDTVGVGFSSLAVKDGRVFTQGDLDGVEHIICLSVKDGSTLWAVQPEPVARQLAAEIQKQLQKSDQDGDGQLDEVEALAGLGWRFNDADQPSPEDAAEIAAERVQRLFKKLDKNSDRRLSTSEVPQQFFDQFAKIDIEDKSADGPELAKQRAAAYLADQDRDQDGKISRDETKNSWLGQFFNRIDEKEKATDKGDDFLTAAEIEAYLFKTEPGRDGFLTVDELEKYDVAQFRGRDGVLSEVELRGAIGGYRNSFGDGPRGTPTVEENRVYAEGGNGDLSCLDVTTGKTIWHVNLRKDFDGGLPGWGYCESPLIEGNLLIVTPGGNAGTILALDKLTGKQVWRSEGVTEGAHYASPQAADIAGTRQIVQFARQNVFGVSADSGKLLWSYGGANNGTANIATPLIFQDHVFAASGYGKGGGLVKIAADAAAQKADEVYFEKKMANHHGGLVRVGDFMYGFGNGGLICMKFLTGEIAWTNGSVRKGSLVYADGMLYCLGEGHQMALVEANPTEYREHGRFAIPELGRPAWAHPVVSGGRLYLRNMRQLTSYDVKAP